MRGNPVPHRPEKYVQTLRRSLQVVEREQAPRPSGELRSLLIAIAMATPLWIILYLLQR
jgi:hypothetical protein